MSLSLRDDIAATLQARLSWPQADGCADDIIARLERRMRDFPLTCEYCKHAPATHVLVADLSRQQARSLVCEPCGASNMPRAREITKAPSSAWLFALIPAGDAPAVAKGEK